MKLLTKIKNFLVVPGEDYSEKSMINTGILAGVLVGIYLAAAIAVAIKNLI